MSALKFIVAGLIVLAVAAGSCKNPLYTKSQFSAIGSPAPRLRLQPAIQTGKAFCGHLHGQLSCCAASTLKTLAGAYNRYETTLTNQINGFVNTAVAHCDSMDKISKNEEFETVRVAAIESIGKSAEKCRVAALEYTRAMLCSGCHPSSSNFVTQNNKFRVARSEVTKLQNACGSFGKSIVNFEKVLVSQSTTLRNSGLKPLNFEVSPLFKVNVAASIFYDVNTLFVTKAASVQPITISKNGFKPIRIMRQVTANASATTSTNASGNISSQFSNITSTLKGKLANATSAIENYFKNAVGLKVLLIPAAIIAFLYN